MATIAICDDNGLQRSMLEDMIRDYSRERGVPISIIPFSNGADLLKNQWFKEYDIYILDIIMPGPSGMDVAEELRRRKDKGQIVFLSDSSEFGVNSYAVNAHYYMLKPLNRNVLYDVLSTALRKISTKVKFEFKTVKETVIVNPKEICYVETVGRAPVIHMTRNRTVQGLMLRGSLRETMKVLFILGDFEMLGPSRIVNLDYVERFRKKGVILSSGDLVEASASAMSDFILKYNDYLDSTMPRGVGL